MSFDAGAIKGAISLDLSGYTGGILKAQSIASLFPSVVTNFMANPLLGLAGIAKSVAGAVVDAARGMVDIFKEVAAAADEAGNKAAQLGVRASFLTSLQGVASGAGVSKEGVNDAIKFLQRNAAQAVSGDETAQKNFATLGISVPELKAGLNDIEGLFGKVAEKIKDLPNAADKTASAMDLLGRGGADMIPIFEKGGDQLQRWQKLIQGVGGDIDQQTAAMASQFSDLGVVWDAVWGGVKKAVAEPFLEFFSDHFDDTANTLIDIGNSLKDVFVAIKPAIKQVLVWLYDAVQVIAKLLNDVADLSVAINNLFGGSAERHAAPTLAAFGLSGGGQPSPQPSPYYFNGESREATVNVNVDASGLDEERIGNAVREQVRRWKQSWDGEQSLGRVRGNM